MQDVVSQDACAKSLEVGESLCPFATLRELFFLDIPLLQSNNLERPPTYLPNNNENI